MPTEFIVSTGPGQVDYSTRVAAEDGLQCDFVSSATKVFGGTKTGTIADNAFVAGFSSLATGTVVHATDTQILIELISGIFQSGEQIRVDVSNYFATTDAGDSVIGIVELATTGAAETAGCIVDGYTLSDANHIEFRAAAGHEAGTKWDDTKYRISLNDVYDPGFLLSDTYVRIVSLQIEQAAARNSDNACVSFNVGGSTECEFHVVRCHIRATNATPAQGTRFNVRSTGGTYKIRDTIFHDCYEALNPSYVDGGTFVFYNNTVIDGGSTYQICILQNSGSPNLYLKNNIVQGTGFQNYYIGTSGWGVYQHGNNISEDTSSPDAAYRSKAVTFVDEAGGDFALDVSDTNAKDQGQSLVSDGVFPFNDDISGNIRGTTWDIGANEYIAVTVAAGMAAGESPTGAGAAHVARKSSGSATVGGSLTGVGSTSLSRKCSGSAIAEDSTGQGNIMATFLASGGAICDDSIGAGTITLSRRVSGGTVTGKPNGVGTSSHTYVSHGTAPGVAGVGAGTAGRTAICLGAAIGPPPIPHGNVVEFDDVQLWRVPMVEGSTSFGMKAVVVEAATSSAAKAIADALYAGDGEADTPEQLVAHTDDYAGATFRIKVSGSPKNIADVVYVAQPGDGLAEVLAGMAAALNHSWHIRHAAYNLLTNTLTVAGAADGFGDHSVSVEVYPIGCDQPIENVNGTPVVLIVDKTSAGNPLLVMFADTGVPRVISRE